MNKKNQAVQISPDAVAIYFVSIILPQETWLQFAGSKATSSAAQQETRPSMARVTQADARCRDHPSLL